jgi:hypothetical protein
MPDLIRSASDVLAVIEADINDASRVAVDVRNASRPEGALALAVAITESRALADCQVALDAVSANSAVRTGLSKIASRAGVTRQPATKSRYTVRTVDGPATWAGGELVRGGGADGTATWRAVTTGVVAAGGALIIEATATGPTQLSSPATLDVVDAVPGTTQLIWESGTDPDGQIGRDVESDGELRARLGTPSPMRRALLNGTSWVVAVSTATPTPGTLALTIWPAPVGTDQEAQLASIVGERTLGIATSGASSVVWAAPGGDSVTLNYAVASTDAVAVAITVTGSGIDTSAVEAAILVYGQTLTASSVVVLAKVSAAAVAVQGVTDVTALTLDAVAANYTPAVGFTPILTVTVVVA